MGLVTLAGTNIQYFSLSEEIQAIVVKFLDFIINVSPGWILFITAVTMAFIIAGVIYRLKTEIENA